MKIVNHKPFYAKLIFLSHPRTHEKGKVFSYFYPQPQHKTFLHQRQTKVRALSSHNTPGSRTGAEQRRTAGPPVGLPRLVSKSSVKWWNNPVTTIPTDSALYTQERRQRKMRLTGCRRDHVWENTCIFSQKPNECTGLIDLTFWEFFFFSSLTLEKG